MDKFVHHGCYLAGQIADAVFVEISDKDTDSAGHKRMMNEVIRDVLYNA